MHYAESDLGAIITAAEFAAVKHRKQRRKGADDIPYVNHPLAVARTLWEVGGVRDVDVLVAAILHDTIEDTGTTAGEISGQFGPGVAALVEEVSDDKSLPKAVRKQLQIEHAPATSPGARLIKLGDKIENVKDIGTAPPADWPLQRRREYLDWADRVVAGLRGVNPALEALFDTVLQTAREQLQAEAAPE